MNHNDVLTIVGAIGAVLCLIFVGMRFYARHTSAARLGMDDWFSLLAFLALVATDTLLVVANSVNSKGAEVASNKNPDYVYSERDVEYTRLSYICTVLYFTIVSTTKLSILLMYNRLFSISKTFRTRVLILSLLTGAFWIGTTVSNLLNCIPMKWVWLNAHADPRYCINYNLYWLGCGVAESVLDLLIIILPVRVVYGLHLTRERKIAVAAIFLLGAFVIISGVVKVILSYIPSSRQPDFERTSLWTAVHVCTGIICACLPICWPFLVRLRKTPWSTIVGQSTIRRNWYGRDGWSGLPHSQWTLPTVKNLTEDYVTSGGIEFSSAPRNDTMELPMYTVGQGRAAGSVNLK